MSAEDAPQVPREIPEPDSLEQMAGQMLMAGFSGTAAPPAALELLLAERHLGGVILFSRNVEDPAQVRALTDRIRGAAPGPPPIVAVDQEGGRVQRFGPPFTRLPPAAVLGATDDPGLGVKWGKLLATELAQVGVNLDLAPVLDVATNPASAVIGDRAFSSHPEDAELVARMGMAVALGLQQRGVGACGKHFPGHGEAGVDSHEELPMVKLSKKRFKKVELPPFKRAAKGGIAALMPGHILVPHLDPERPASLSEIVLKGLLRADLDFSGVVITDDLEMGAVSGRYDLETMLRWGLEAEIDVFLFCHTLEKVAAALDLLVAWARAGTLGEARLRRSWDRIARFKAEYRHDPVPLDPALLGAPAHRRLVEIVRERAAAAGYRP